MRDLGIKAVILSVLLAMTGIAICAPFFDHADAQEGVVVIVPPDGLSQENPMDLILGFEAIAAEVHRHDSVNVLILMTDAPYENGDVYLAITMAIGEGRFVTADELRSSHPAPIPVMVSSFPQSTDPSIDLDFLTAVLDHLGSDHESRKLADHIQRSISDQRAFMSKLKADSELNQARSAEVQTPKEDESDSELSAPSPVIVEDESVQDESDNIDRHIIGTDPTTAYSLPEIDGPESLPTVGRGTVI